MDPNATKVGRSHSLNSDLWLSFLVWKMFSTLPPAVRSTSTRCRHRNGGCEHFCRVNPDRSKVCFCAPGYGLDQDNSTCLPQGLRSNGGPCSGTFCVTFLPLSNIKDLNENVLGSGTETPAAGLGVPDHSRNQGSPADVCFGRLLQIRVPSVWTLVEQEKISFLSYLTGSLTKSNHQVVIPMTPWTSWLS